MSNRSVIALTVLLVGALGCPEKKVEPDPPPAIDPLRRCDVDIATMPELFASAGTGARALQVSAPEHLIGGQFAGGSNGDFLLENDRVRIIVGRPGRKMAHTPFGGNILDADLLRAPGTPGRDQLGELGFLYGFGRTADVQRIEILSDGSAGGPAIVAATGRDVLNDYVTLQEGIDSAGVGLELVVDPEADQPVRATTYYVLSPGDSRVRVLTAFCNESDKALQTTVGELSAQGGTMDFFNPDGCSKELGDADCFPEASSWFGFQGDGVAYAMRGYRFDDLLTPEPKNALVYMSGSVATIAAGEGLQGVLKWTDASAPKRPGAFVIPADGQKLYLRDLYVGPHLGEVMLELQRTAGLPHGLAEVTVHEADGTTPAANTRVRVSAGDRLISMLVTDAAGKARVGLPPKTYRFTAARIGAGIGSPEDVSIESGATANVSLRLGASRSLTVRVSDPLGNPLPAKVTVECVSDVCNTPYSEYAKFLEIEKLPTNVAAIGYVPPHGELTLQLPPGRYEVIVTRGPEYSLYPSTWPTVPVTDLTTSDQLVAAVLAQVIDSSDWISADLHVHGVNSADSSVPHDVRVLSFTAEDVKVLVGTDHEFVTDYRPTIASLEAQAFVRAIVGTEISPSYGHHNAFPVVRDDSLNGGAIDWAGATGPTLRFPEIYAQVRANSPSAILQMNHPRGKMGVLTRMRVDTDSGASHAAPEPFRMAAAPDATAGDTRLFSDDFDAIEVQNGMNPNYAVLNDWMTFLSRGSLKTATSVSDTHGALSAPAGYGRTYVAVGSNSPSAFEEATFVDRLRSRRAFGTNGPFLRVQAQRLDAADLPIGDVVGIGETISLGSALEKLEIRVDVQAPEWMQFDSIELYTHAAGREAKDGAENTAWPAERIHQKKSFPPAALPTEEVTVGGAPYRRVRVVTSFVVTPDKDNWYVVMLRSSSAVRNLYPLAFRGIRCEGSVCTANSGRPFAVANPIFVDADGSGSYDDFPLKVMRSLPVAPPPRPPRRRATEEDVIEALHELNHEH